MLIKLLSGFTRQVHGNLAKICAISILTATDQPPMSHRVFSHHFDHHSLFQPSQNSKSKARDFSALNRHKNTAGGRESGINVVYPFFFFFLCN